MSGSQTSLVLTVRLVYPFPCAVLSRSVVSDPLGPHGLQPARPLCPWGFSMQEYWIGLPSSPPGDLPDPRIKPKCRALQADSLPIEPPGKPNHPPSHHYYLPPTTLEILFINSSDVFSRASLFLHRDDFFLFFRNITHVSEAIYLNIPLY